MKISEGNSRLDPRTSAPLIHKPRIWSKLQIWCGYFAVTIAAVAISVQYLDRPISRFTESLFGQFAWIGNFTDTPSFFDPLALLVFGIFLLRRLVARKLGRLDVACLLSDASLLLADLVNGKLKYLFGRTWPKYGCPSFIHQGVYGFNPLHSGHAYQSFPSGHVAAVCALLSILWILYPRFRVLYALTAIGFSAALIATNYHFLADVIAGGFLGASIGLICVSAWQRWGRCFSSESSTAGSCEFQGAAKGLTALVGQVHR